MLYNKKYGLSDVFNYNDMNEFCGKVIQMLNALSSKIDMTDPNKFPTYIDGVRSYVLNDFPYVEEIDDIEKTIMNVSFEFYQPLGYIQNKVWKDKDGPVYKYFGYNDINRMITDINLLYEHRNDTITMYNLYSNDYWDGSSTLNWEE